MSMSQQQQLKLQKAAQAQKEQQALADVAINGLITSATLHNGPIANGEVAAASTHTALPVQQPQVELYHENIFCPNWVFTSRRKMSRGLSDWDSLGVQILSRYCLAFDK